ncbi:hypothetical protein CC1G_07598 [Coprinopsis cinerea okayama7|uniref:Zinc finger PHD-type domain-containing protein n=1 Tax=Coprinopsis cinerea (strain Okayama-7 / 130 / ATCC MYA-4618 / FGSC 9003) TaxID=240176 RepID=A8NUR4_COPC7|nr:hypothetical protein CC1G_07598 [Coprinopsis cinerea okayama7\|eukprot:XP_001836515.2 hypothetical protein CC1G_07598 [Coprinopsis cinerea okayama7\
METTAGTQNSEGLSFRRFVKGPPVSTISSAVVFCNVSAPWTADGPPPPTVWPGYAYPPPPGTVYQGSPFPYTPHFPYPNPWASSDHSYQNGLQQRNENRPPRPALSSKKGSGANLKPKQKRPRTPSESSVSENSSTEPDSKGSAMDDSDERDNEEDKKSDTGSIDDDPDWPNGDIERRCIEAVKQELRLGETKWAWRSNGCRPIGGRMTETRKCLGVLVCSRSSCPRAVRPKTQTAARNVQLMMPCTLCKSPLTHHACDVKSLHYTVVDGGESYAVWEHIGTHAHRRPPDPRRLTRTEQGKVDEQVARAPKATVHQLRVGESTPGSVPLHSIKPTLAHPKSAHYAVQQSRKRQGLTSLDETIKGTYSLIEAFATLNEKFGEEFLIESSLSSPAYLMYQTKWMRSVLGDAVVGWSKGLPELVGQHGGVTDGNHSYFDNGTLVATAVYDTVIQSWVPILYTWVHKVDTQHHLPHFRKVAHQIVDTCQEKGMQLKDEFLLHVFDFAQPEHAAHAESFVEAKIRVFSNWHQLTPEAQAIQKAEWLKTAERYQIGCRVHFKRSANRIQSSHSLVPPENGASFMSKVHQLVSTKTSLESFNSIVDELAKTYPRIVGWLGWWLRSRIASLIFPAKSAVDPDLRKKVPNSSNVIESIHHLTNHAVGKGHDIIEGAQGLLLHSRELQAQHQAILVGHNDPLPARAPKQPTRRAIPVDDSENGRAPDTVERLGLVPSVPQQSVTGSEAIPPLELIAYRWNGKNSCFWDVALELWYRAYSCWPEREAEKIRLLLKETAKNSFLTWLIFHFHNRRQSLKSNNRNSLKRDLFTGQGMTEFYIFDKWRLLNPGDYGTPTLWLTHAVQDSSPPLPTQQHFGIQQVIFSRCSHGHAHTFYDPTTPIVPHTVSIAFVHALTLEYGRQISIGDYLSRWIPNRHSYTTPLHIHHSVSKCNHEGCSKDSHFVEAVIYWPMILSLSVEGVREPGTTGASATAYPSRPVWDNTIEIEDDDGKVTYELVGRAIYDRRRQHYTSQVRFRNKCFEYDDISMNGSHPSLVESPDMGLLQSKVPEAPLYVYHRTSTKASTSRSKEAILSDYSLLTKLERPIMVEKATKGGETVIESASESESDDDSIDSLLHDILNHPVASTRGPSTSPKPSEPLVLPARNPSRPPSPAPSSTAGDEIPEPIVCTNRDSRLWCEKDESNGYYTGTFDLDFVSCPLCNQEYHFVCVRGLLPSTCEFPFDIKDQKACWCCLQCQYGPNSTLDHALIGQTVLINAHWFSVSNPLYYPAKILRRDRASFILQWSEFNVYKASYKPQTMQFALPPLECYRAKMRPVQEYKSNSVLGTMRCPTSLHPDSKVYPNVLAKNTIADAYDTVHKILISKETVHPITKIFAHYMKNRTNEAELKSETMSFLDEFWFPLFPGDDALISQALVRLEGAARNVAPGDLDLHTHIAAQATVLFSVVLARVAIGAQPKHDGEIFYLGYRGAWRKEEVSEMTITQEIALHGALTRKPTPYEEAILASQGAEDTTVLPTSRLEARFSFVEDPTLPNATYTDFPIRSLRESGNPFEFEGSIGLSLQSSGYTPGALKQPLSSSNASPQDAKPKRPRPTPAVRRNRAQVEFRILEPSKAYSPEVRPPLLQGQEDEDGRRRSKRRRTDVDYSGTCN